MKKTNKIRKLIPLFIAIFAVIAICSVGFLMYSFSGNYINYINVDNKADSASDVLAKNSNIIIMNGVVLGASKDGNWISAERFYDENKDANKLEVNVYSQNEQYGTFVTATLKRHRDKVVYTTIAKTSLPQEYLAVSSNIVKTSSNIQKIEANDEDEKIVKQAIGGYGMLNSSVNVTEVYTARIKNSNDRIICATAKKASIFGVYSAVIYVSENKATLVKYSCVKDKDNSDRWPVYSLKFIHDLDGEGVPEIILEEVTGSDVRYTVQELRNDGLFYQVLNTSIPL